MNGRNKTIVAVLEDLFFMVKISDGAKRAGLAIQFVKSEADLMERAASHPAAIIIDMNFTGIQPLDVIAKFKADEELKKINLIAYLSHVQGDLKQKALQAGCDVVLARSAFSLNLPTLLKRHAGSI